MYFERELQVYLLIFGRISALLLSMPFLGSQGIRPMARGGLVFFISLAVMPMLSEYPIEPSATALDLALSLLAEVFIGLLMGFMIKAFFAIFQTAGSFFSLQMALSSAQLLNPMSESQEQLLAQFMHTIALFLFLSVGPLHIFLLEVMAQSFLILPTAKTLLLAHESLLEVMFYTMNFLMEKAFLLALPIISVIMLISIMLGLMAKAAPQMNLLVLGFPIQIGVGFLTLFFAIPLLIEQITTLLDYGLRELPYIIGTGSYSDNGAAGGAGASP